MNGLPIACFVLGLQTAGLPMPQEGNAIVAVTERFELRSDPRTALHHFLIDWASADAGEWPPYAVQLSERDDWRSVLSDDEQRTWSSAVKAYGATVGRSLLFDEGMLATRDWAAGAAPREGIPDTDQSLAASLDAALPIYRRHWWPTHDARNREWVESVSSTLAAVEEEMIGRFQMAYGGRWPSEPTPVDVMVYANAVGAYSTGGRLTISSVPRGNQMPQAIEIIFHEASHTDPLEQPLRSALSRAFRAAGGDEPELFWHDVIFYSSGEITRLVLKDHGTEKYEHYGTLGVYRRGARWSVELPAFEDHWRPFLESRSREAGTREAALEALARRILLGQ